MPEGPEVRRYALQLASALENESITHFSARTRDAKAFLLEHPNLFQGRNIERIRSHGKHLFGTIEGDIGFHSHLMMWGRWSLHRGAEVVEIDRRERARIETPDAVAILLSAPVFEIFQGDPYREIANLTTLGPDVLPYDGPFDTPLWQKRLLAPENGAREIGAVLLDQRISAGIGNYLRADILFFCRIDPYKRVGELSSEEIAALSEEIPRVARRAFEGEGISVPPALRERLLSD
ncbi:MAG: hypothetical protein KY445_14605, partial [Armatimonadetes bacterium]|nr:hypothetical protein [Armatimonadota bacterium]